MNIRLVSADSSAVELVAYLAKSGYEVEVVRLGGAALRDLLRVDLVLLDLDIVDREGLKVCQDIRAQSDLPVLCFTDRTEELDRVLALRAGADDCLVRPFGLRELIARIDAITRRLQGPSLPPSQPVIMRGPIRIDPQSREVRVHGRLVVVTRKEFELLLRLASSPEEIVSRKRLLDEIWAGDWKSPGRTLDTHVSSIRSKLGSKGWIVTVRGVGFRFGRE